MRKFLKAKIWNAWQKIEFVTAEIVTELQESRSILNWIYCLGYGWLVWYCVTHNPAAMITAITVTGAVVSAIFASYVFTKGREKVTEITEKHKTKRSNGKHEDEGDA